MTIGDKIRSMNDEELAKLLIGCIDYNQSGYADWDSLYEPYLIHVTERLTIAGFDAHDLSEELSMQFFNDDGSHPEIKNCKVGTVTV